MDNHKLRIDRDLLLDFFLTFSRFEFALKDCGFATGDENGVTPNWDAFASSLSGTFNQGAASDLSMACEYIMASPPMKQVLLDGRIAWSTGGELEAMSPTVLLLLVRRVRNNLFHGGKFSAETFEETDRQDRLLKSCLVILRGCLSLSPMVAASYESAIL